MNSVDAALLIGYKRVLAVEGFGDSLRGVLAVKRGKHQLIEHLDAEGIRSRLAADPVLPIIAALPASKVLSPWLVTPFESKTKSARVLPSVLDVMLPFPLESCQYIFSNPVVPEQLRGRVPVVGLEGANIALAAATRKRDLAETIEALKAQGVEPHAIDHEGWALWYGSLREHPAANEGVIRGVIYFGAEHITASLGCGEVFWGSQEFALGETQALERWLRLQIQTQCEGALEHASREWVLGGDVTLDAKAQLLARLPGSVRELPEGKWGLSCLLATRALHAGVMQRNLRFGEFCHAGQAGANEKELRIRSAILVGVATVLFVLNFAGWLFAGLVETRLARRLRDGASAVAGYRVAARGRNALLIAERSLAEREAIHEQWQNTADVRASWAKIVSDAHQAGVSLQHLELQVKGVMIEGRATERIQVQELERRLSGLDVAWSPVVYENTPDGFDFQMIGKWEGE